MNENQTAASAAPSGSAEDDRQIHLVLNRLPVGPINCLYREDIKTMGQLLACTKADLLAIRNLGATKLDAILKELARHGLTLAEEGLLVLPSPAVPGAGGGGSMSEDRQILDAFQAVWIDPAGQQGAAEAIQCRHCQAVVFAPRGDGSLTMADLAGLCSFHRCETQSRDVRMVTIAHATDMANADVNDIRRWCINGQVQAFKARGRWLIVEESLHSRLAALDDLIDVLVGVDGSLWTREGTRRVYFNDFWAWAGVEFPDPIAEGQGIVVLDGKRVSIANGLLRLQVSKAFVDLGKNALILQHYGDINTVAYLDGEDQAGTLHLLGRLCSGFTRATGVVLGAPVPLQEYRRAGTCIPIVAFEDLSRLNAEAIDNRTEDAS